MPRSDDDGSRAQARLLAEDEHDDDAFVGISCPKLDLRGKRFTGCTFEGLHAPEAQLESAVFSDCTFVRCDLTMARVAECSFRGASFERSKMMGIDWSLARDLIFDVSFDTCILSYGSFVKRRMREVRIVGCTAHETDFSEADLTSADFSRTDLRDARFSRTNLTRANLSSAEHYRIDPTENTLKGTRFSVEAAMALVATLGIVVESC